MTENPLNKLLNPEPGPPPPTPDPHSPLPPALQVPGTRAPQPAPAQRPAQPQNQPTGAGGTSAMDPSALRAAGRSADGAVAHLRQGGKAFVSESDRVGDALGAGWQTAAAMKEVSAAWSQALRRMADEVEYLGGAVEKCATNRQWADEQIKDQISRIRTGK
ncbi:type VII secretion target [Actinomadura rayongensis]|uniref:Uncharacterized protein n=1 Tax=Actinomadura rayongensis TaxID=1429076 RepID=A0A6I4W974_9ACTN|nr:type VII secretion target [Actinomadura rayongensis]MXQ64825.1 hypothetical protein [Actinomadura rayongensis]